MLPSHPVFFSASKLLQPPMVLRHYIEAYAEKFGSHEPLLPLLCGCSGTHGREDKRHVLEQSPRTHTYTSMHTRYMRAHQKHFLFIPFSHPLFPSVIKGFSIEALMRRTHFKRNTLQSLCEKKSLDNVLFSQETIPYILLASSVRFTCKVSKRCAKWSQGARSLEH